MMLLDIRLFLNLSFVDVLDILVVAIVIFLIFRWSRGTLAMNIIIAILAMIFINYIAIAFGMKLFPALLSVILDVGAVAIIIIFQPEIRRFLSDLGRRGRGGSRSLLERLRGKKESGISSADVDEIAEACREMAEQKTGALIVLQNYDELQDIIDTGDIIDSQVRKRLIMNIFFKNSPLHDGAMIIGGGRIIAARCTLPITERQDIPARFGMRHKAAIGLSERYDADVIVVSEQTGKISYMQDGQISPVANINTLKLLLTKKNDRQEAGVEAGV